MYFSKFFLLVFFLIFSSSHSLFASSPDDSNSNLIQTNKINSSSFSNFVESMDKLGFDNIYFKRASNDYKSSIEEKYLDVSKSKNANKIFELFLYELNENPHFAYKNYNEALLHLYDLSPKTFEKNSIILKNSLIESFSRPYNPESSITYTDELDCGSEENYEPCKKLYQNKMRLPFMLLLILAGIW